MHDDTNACNYGIGIGVLAFLFCIGFLILDAMFDNISNIQHRKYAVIADIGVSGETICSYHLTHCILVVSSTVICWMSPFVILGCQIYFVAFLSSPGRPPLKC